MAHEITRNNFFNNDFSNIKGEPAWHGLSIFNKLEIEKEEREYTATEIWGLFGKPVYQTHDLFWKDADGKEYAIDDQLIVRLPVADDPVHKVIGRASEHYELIGAEMAAPDWDKHVQLSVETMMTLRDDKILVITTALPEYTVGNNDGVKNYLVYANGMDGRTASRADVTGVRVVCANTLRAAQSRTFHHTAGSHSRIIEWMSNLAEKAIFENDVMRDVYNVLSTKSASEGQMTELAETVLQIEAKPSPDFSYANGYENRLEWWERHAERIEQHRATFVQAFNESNIVGFTDAENNMRGTAWAALNVVTQYATHYTGNGAEKTAESLLIGKRGDMIDLATKTVINWYPEAQEIFYGRQFTPALVNA